MNIRRLTLGALETNCYLLDDGQGGPVVIVDPAGEAGRILSAIDGEPLLAVVLTHGHFDHLGAATELLAARPAPLMVHERDALAITTAAGSGGALFGFHYTPPPAERLLSHGETIAAGALKLTVLHTPGHTPGSVCLLGDGELFSGDTLFAGSVGRTDFPGGDARLLRASIAQLAALPGETRVHPGHGPGSTIARERRVNPFFPRA